VLVTWDTLDAPTYRHDVLPGYQGGREFDDELVNQVEVLPQFVTACGFACAKVAGYEADDFLAAAVAREERRGGTTIVATGDRDDRSAPLPPLSSQRPTWGKAADLARYWQLKKLANRLLLKAWPSAARSQKGSEEALELFPFLGCARECVRRQVAGSSCERPMLDLTGKRLSVRSAGKERRTRPHTCAPCPIASTARPPICSTKRTCLRMRSASPIYSP
jgi:hypothetical protein